MDSKDLAMDRVERCLMEVIPLLEGVNDERHDDRIALCVNALKVCVEVLRGEH